MKMLGIKALSVLTACVIAAAASGGSVYAAEEAAPALRAVASDTSVIYTTEHRNGLEEWEAEPPHLWAWGNDRADFQLSLITGGHALKQVRVTAEGGTVPAEWVRISFIEETLAYGANATDPELVYDGVLPEGDRVSGPDILAGDDPVDVEADEVQPVWVSIRVPKDTPAGNYTLRLHLTWDGDGEGLSVELPFRTVGVSLPDPQEYRFDIELWQYPYSSAEYYGVEPFSERHLAILKKQMELYRDLGGHAITASIVEEAWGGQTYSANEVHYPSMIRWIRQADGTFRFDYTQFDQWVSLNRELGIGDKIICYSMIPWENQVSYYDEASGSVQSVAAEAGTPEYSALWTPFLQSFVAHLDEKGWFDAAYIGIDERDNMAQAFDVIDSVRNREGKTLKIAGAMNHFDGDSAPIAERVDSVSVGSETARENLKDFEAFVQSRRDSGKDVSTTLYTCVGHFPNSFALSMPCESYWTILFCAKEKTTGFMRWAYDAWVEDPLEDTTHMLFEAGDCFLIYPDGRDSADPTPRMSVRLAKLAEGVRDVNKLYQISEQFPQLGEEVDQLLKGVRRDYSSRKVNLGRSTAYWASRWTQWKMPRDMAELREEIYRVSTRYALMSYGFLTIHDDLTAGEIAGLIAAGAAILGVIAGGTVWIVRRKRKRKS